ncbi:MAG: uroporphyrinogen decarboxylase family protein [Lentisphaeria bacterium]|nr:uroporphyrinogen decarboxylase family protein [Lentisphaeria bacterium]
MTMRERILAVYRGETPDVVPFMLDLSHWFNHRHRRPFDIDKPVTGPDYELIDYHRQVGAGFYLANLTIFSHTRYTDDVAATVERCDGNGRDTITWRLDTPVGAIERCRVWEPQTYAWGIRDWGVKTQQDLRVLQYALAHRTFSPDWDQYHAWAAAIGDNGVLYMPVGYSAIGHLMNLWMGVEGLVFAASDWPELLREVVDTINDNTLVLVDLIAASPADVVMITDNFSSDTQPPGFFNRWSRTFYEDAVDRLHAAGKYVAVHIDGRLRGALSMIRDTGADCADAVTPAPLGDLTAAACRGEAGDDFILSGGVPPDVWLPEADVERFETAVLDWLELRRVSPGLIAAAGDQVPPGAAEDRIRIMRDLIDDHGRYDY